MKYDKSSQLVEFESAHSYVNLLSLGSVTPRLSGCTRTTLSPLVITTPCTLKAHFFSSASPLTSPYRTSLNITNCHELVAHKHAMSNPSENLEERRRTRSDLCDIQNIQHLGRVLQRSQLYTSPITFRSKIRSRPFSS